MREHFPIDYETMKKRKLKGGFEQCGINWIIPGAKGLSTKVLCTKNRSASALPEKSSLPGTALSV
ncbi:MAG TPA: hypothetical protein DEF88_13440 [Porphyromonadaceae bacterium]|nr:hypothetical protein [Porphyromonadaceae bacterium]